MSSRKYYICKPFYDREESRTQCIIDEEELRIEEIMNEYNLLDPNYMHYIESDPYDRYYYDDYYHVEEDPNDWYDWHNEYLTKLNEDIADLKINDNLMKSPVEFIFHSEIRSFKNCWNYYTKRINDNCLSIYVAPFLYLHVPMADILRDLSSYEEFQLEVINFQEQDFERFPFNIQAIPINFLYARYLVSHDNPLVLDLLHAKINELSSLFFNIKQNSPVSEQEILNKVDVEIDHEYLFQCTSQKVRTESLLNQMSKNLKTSGLKKKI